MSVAVMLARKGHDLITARPGDRMIEVCRLLETHGIGSIVITDKSGRLAGIVSERDFVRALAREGAGFLDQPVSAFMTSDVATCSPEDSVAEVMERMTEGKFRHLPVIEDGRLIGLVSIGDAVKHRIAEAEAESQAMREYIAAG